MLQLLLFLSPYTITNYSLFTLSLFSSPHNYTHFSFQLRPLCSPTHHHFFLQLLLSLFSFPTQLHTFSFYSCLLISFSFFSLNVITHSLLTVVSLALFHHKNYSPFSYCSYTLSLLFITTPLVLLPLSISSLFLFPLIDIIHFFLLLVLLLSNCPSSNSAYINSPATSNELDHSSVPTLQSRGLYRCRVITKQQQQQQEMLCRSC